MRHAYAGRGLGRPTGVCLVILLSLAGCASSSQAPHLHSVAARPLPPLVGIDDGYGRTVPMRLNAMVDGGRLVSGFGWRGGNAMGGRGAYHEGIDIAAPRGTPVRAAAAGTIAEVGRDRGYGRYVRIRHSERIETLYAHLSRSSSAAEIGRRVTPDDVIGYVGSSGRSTGPHLHFEVRRAGSPVDPLALASTRVAQGKAQSR